jgi:hypothetical protein
MIANINIDMFLPIVPLKVLTVYGLAESDLGDMAREVAQSVGVQVQADPEPQRNAFIRLYPAWRSRAGHGRGIRKRIAAAGDIQKVEDATLPRAF